MNKEEPAAAPAYPHWLCRDCGTRHGQHPPRITTWHPGQCGLCKRRDVPVTEPRDFGHLRPGWENSVAPD